MLFKEGKAHWMRNFTFSIMIVIAQGIGGVVGLFITAGGFSFTKQSGAKKITESGYHVAQLCPYDGCNDGGDMLPKVLIVESVCTFLYVSMVLMVVKHNGADQMPINAFVIGLSLYLSL